MLSSFAPTTWIYFQNWWITINKHNKRHDDFLGNADYGVCISRKLKYFGFNLVTVTTMRGIPMLYGLVPVNLDERLAAEAIINQRAGCDLFADKGFLGLEWQTQIFVQTNSPIWTPHRSNQQVQNARNLGRWLNSVRERIEDRFHEI